MDKLTAGEKVIRAKVQLNKTNPFFAYIVMHMRFKEVKEIPSMGVDADGHCFYNAEFVDKISNDETIGVVCHEAMHIALQHMNRLNGRDKHIFNVSNDLTINMMLLKNKLMLPSNGLIPNESSDSWEYKGKKGKSFTLKDISKKTSEEIYEELLKNSEKEKMPEGFDIHNYDNKDGKVDIKALSQKWGRIMSEAYNYAKNQGKEPLGAGRLIDGLLQGKMHWKQLLQKYITQSLPYDYTYSRRHKKSISCGYYIPAIKKDTIDIACAIDTSGSISQHELTEFLSEIVSIAKSHENLRMTIVDCDASINNELEVANGNISKILNMKVSGGGGTSHKPVFEYFEKKARRPKLLICFTDGYTDCPKNSFIETLWIITKGGSVASIPFGRIVKCDEL